MAKLSALTNTNKSQLNNAGSTTLSKRRPIETIKPHPEFESLFGINETTYQEIKDSMKKNGYDESQPVIIWKEQDCLIDGYTRKKVAIDLGYYDIPIHERSFVDIDEAMEYALIKQIGRRNLSEGELAKAILKLDKLKKRGVKSEDDPDQEKGKSADILGKKLNISGRKIEKLRSIDKNTPDITQKIINDELSIEAGYQQSRKRVKAEEEAYKEDVLREAGISITPKVPEPKQKTLYEKLVEMPIEEFAQFLHNVQHWQIKTVDEWIDALKQIEMFDNPAEEATDDVEINIENI